MRIIARRALREFWERHAAHGIVPRSIVKSVGDIRFVTRFADARAALDTAASRHHAEVFAVGDMFFLRDLGSRNGTYLNEERLKELAASIKVHGVIQPITVSDPTSAHMSDLQT